MGPKIIAVLVVASLGCATGNYRNDGIIEEPPISSEAEVSIVGAHTLFKELIDIRITAFSFWGGGSLNAVSYITYLFLPSTFQNTEDQLAQPSARADKSRDERDNQPDRTQRFGITDFGNTGPYGSTAPGLYGPVKIDLGGVLLGSILGFGAVIILPKIIHALSYGYGGYGRSVETDLGSVSDMVNRIDEVLTRYNVDSSSCMQRLACSYVQLANENSLTGNATEFDALLTNLSSNSLVRRMLDGTSIYEAMSTGRSPDSDCQQLYPKCKLDRKTVVKMITQLVPS